MLAIPLFLCAQAAAPGSALDRVVALELDAADPILTGHGPSERIEHVAGFAGSLHVWATSEPGFDPYLRVERGEEGPAAEDDDSGGKPVPYVKLEVEAGARLVLVARAQAVEAGASLPARVELHLVAAPETEATRTASSELRAALAAVRELRGRGEYDVARERVAPVAAEHAQVAGGDASDLMADVAR